MHAVEHYQAAEKIKLVIFDVDGVLTDGGLYFFDNGLELKRFNALDGLGIKIIKKYGIEPAIITSGDSMSVDRRVQDLGILHYYKGENNKLIAFNNLLKNLAIEPYQAAYVGDDIIDLLAMKKAGLKIAVANAHELVKKCAHIVTTKTGGNGAVREVCDFLLKAQNKYDKAMSFYENEIILPMK